jgi:hypothetical protein
MFRVGDVSDSDPLSGTTKLGHRNGHHGITPEALVYCMSMHVPAPPATHGFAAIRSLACDDGRALGLAAGASGILDVARGGVNHGEELPNPLPVLFQ